MRPISNKKQSLLFVHRKMLSEDAKKEEERIRMKVNVKYFATLREITGKREEEIELQEDSTVRDLLDRLVDRHGTRFKEYVVEEKTSTPRAHLLFLIDGTSVNSLGGLGAKLTHNCVVALMPPVGGG